MKAIGRKVNWTPEPGEYLEGVYLGFRQFAEQTHAGLGFPKNLFCIRADSGTVYFETFEDAKELTEKFEFVLPGERVKLTYNGPGVERFTLEVE